MVSQAARFKALKWFDSKLTLKKSSESMKVNSSTEPHGLDRGKLQELERQGGRSHEGLHLHIFFALARVVIPKLPSNAFLGCCNPST